MKHPPLTIFLIGITGDLAKKKILKAIYQLFQKKLLPEAFTLIGNARRPMTTTQFHDFVKTTIKPTDLKTWNQFIKNLHYVSGDTTNPQTFTDIGVLHKQLQQHTGCGNHIWYIATLPQLYLNIIKNLKHSMLHNIACGWTKILIEKPFGTDLTSAQALNNELTSVFTEDQIYRIDHFLGKETVQNLLAFRFANGLFEELWNKDYIDHFQVTLSETLGVDGREHFYDATGATRDVVQNHLLQMIAVTMMEEPVSLNPEDIRESRSRLLQNLSCHKQDQNKPAVFFGQFTTGTINNHPVKGYLEHDNIPANSSTETAVALKLQVNNDRWRGVPIYIRTGKRFAASVLEISIQFKDPQNAMFKSVKYGPDPNILTFRFQPNEAIILRLFVKKPGHGIELDMVPMEFNYHNQYQMDFIEAYERLILDASRGDPTLFPGASSIESSWQIIDTILNYKQQIEPHPYPAGTWGPASFYQLIESDGRSWIDPK